MSDVLLSASIPGLRPRATGKVRDVYDLGSEILIVASDRVSAFDVVMPNGVPDKGKVLTQISRYWFRRLRPSVATHYITTDIAYICRRLRECGASVTSAVEAGLDGRAMLVVKAEILPVECVVRGYLAGSLWSEYCRAGGPERAVTIHGLDLPSGIRQSERLPEPIFTPSTKAASGHDESISLEQMAGIVGRDTADRLARLSIDVYNAGAEHARKAGVIIADTKFEFGLQAGSLTLCDEVLTPDSSRFWDGARFEPGKSQPSYDKQPIRDWLVATGWNKEPPAPALPPDVVASTTARYREAYRLITGCELD